MSVIGCIVWLSHIWDHHVVLCQAVQVFAGADYRSVCVLIVCFAIDFDEFQDGFPGVTFAIDFSYLSLYIYTIFLILSRGFLALRLHYVCTPENIPDFS